jgi:hypothetical protein
MAIVGPLTSYSAVKGSRVPLDSAIQPVRSRSNDRELSLAGSVLSPI